MNLRGRITATAALSAMGLGLLGMCAPASHAAPAAATPIPVLASVNMVAPTSVDTSAAAQQVAVRVALKATPTASITDVRLTFYRHLAGNGKANIVVFAASNKSAATAYRECDANHHAIAPVAGDTTMCLVSGAVANGVFELRNLLPQGSNPGTYALDRVEVRDSLGRRLDLDYATLVTRKQSVAFAQTGAGDSTAPALISTQMVSTNINTASGDAIVALRVHATDDLSGVYLVSARFRRAVVNNGITTYLTPETVASSFAARACPAPSAIPPLVGQYGYVCRESGNKLDGTYLAYFLMKRWSAQGTYQLTNLSLVDAAQNRLDDIDIDLVNANASASFIQSGIGDVDGPTARVINVVTAKVTAKSAKYEPVIKVAARDNISGIKQIWVEYKSAVKATAPAITFTTTDIPCSVASAVNHCRYSGTAKDGVWRIHAIVAASVPKGAWNLYRVRLLDNAGNLTVLSGASMKAAKLSSTFTLA